MNAFLQHLSIVVLLLSSAAWAQSPVRLIDDDRGVSQEFAVGTYRADRGQLNRIGNDRATSVTVASGYQVRLCEHEGNGSGSGRCEAFSSGTHNLKWKKITSFVFVMSGSASASGANAAGNPVAAGPVVLIDDDRGVSQVFQVGTFRADRGQLNRIGNDKATSVRVGAGHHARLCEHEGNGAGSGRCEEFSSGTYQLKWKKITSLVQVR